MTPTPEAIAATSRLLRPYVRCTPLLTLAPTDLALTEAPLTFKLEQVQHSGSFKARGAFAHLLQRPIPPAGVAAASGGNHGAAVAYAAHRLGIRATIFVPSIASPAKLDRIRRYGAELVVGGERYADALERCDAFVLESGALSVHAYDAVETLLGAGSLGEELDLQQAGIDTLLVAVGGGGLIGGLAAWFRGRIRLIGVEPTGAPTLARARAAGRPVDTPVGGLAADSLGARRVGALAFPLAEAFVSDIVLVEDDDIRQAQAVLWDRLRLVTEPGGAAAFAALLAGRVRPTDRERVGVLLCGANADPASVAGPPSP